MGAAMMGRMADLRNDPFRPLPLLGNPHVQTLLGAFLPGRGCPPPKRRHVLTLPDGDALLLYENTPRGWHAGGESPLFRSPSPPEGGEGSKTAGGSRPPLAGAIALLLHGLTGCHASPHIRRMA